jgi:octaprenyl-diphosphate synthase
VKYFTKPELTVQQASAALGQITQIFALIQPHLDAAEAAVHAQTERFDPAIRGYVMYACQTQGKRLRPALALLSAGATGEISERHEKLAVILELVHLATLVHDDILDGAEIRRDQPTANARWGSTISVLLGDCLFAHALELATQFEDAEISRRIARASSAVCTGEILQTQRRFDLNLGVAEYYRIIELKTAALFGAAAELGACLNHVEPATAAALKTYGLKIGVAYQVYDDLLDLAGDETAAGKTLGTDLKKGKLTLPMLELLQAAQNGQHEHLTRMILRGEEADLRGLREAARDAGAIDAAARAGCELIEEGVQQLEVLPASLYREAMAALGQRLGAMLMEIV